jgi:hypothetical protein
VKEKECKHCGTKENLRTNKNGGIYNCCIHCYETIEIPDQMKKTKEALLNKYGVTDLGELRKKRLIENPPKEKEKKQVICKYCGSLNIVTKQTNKRFIEYSVCKDHWEKYQKEKYEVRKKTNKEKFNVENPMDSLEIIIKHNKNINNKSIEEKKLIENKRIETNRNNYGVDYPLQSFDIQKSHIENVFNKYGVQNVMQVHKFKEKQKQSILEHYGVDNPFKITGVKDKIRKTNLEKYGYEFPSQSSTIQNKILISRRSTYWDKFIYLLSLKNLEPLFSKETYITSKNSLDYKCLICNNIFSSKGTEPQRISCGCYSKTSSYEYEIRDWLSSYNIINIVRNIRNLNEQHLKYEIDVYLPDYSIGIDFHGLYFHSSLMKDTLYHFKKYDYFKQKNIKFIQIFENEWLSKQDIVKSIILNKLGKSEKIYARKCILKEVSYEESLVFLNTNHIQGYTPASIKIGLYYKDELVCIGTFGQNRFNKKDNSIELIRFANKMGITVIGGFQKILSYYEKTYTPLKLISFADLRYFYGESLIKTGFSLEKVTNPNYFYFKKQDPSKLYSRREFQKHLLANKLDIFDPVLSEYENMLNNGYLRIFDAGNLKMVKNYT